MTVHYRSMRLMTRGSADPLAQPMLGEKRSLRGEKEHHSKCHWITFVCEPVQITYHFIYVRVLTSLGTNSNCAATLCACVHVAYSIVGCLQPYELKRHQLEFHFKCSIMPALYVRDVLANESDEGDDRPDM